MALTDDVNWALFFCTGTVLVPVLKIYERA